MTGCHNYNELEDLAICTAMAIDVEDNNYKVSYMIANSKKIDVSSKEGEAQTIIYSGVGETLDKAINEISLISPKIVYIGHLGIIVISDELARNGVKNVLDYLLRVPESRKSFKILLTNGNKALDVLKILSPLETFPSRNILSNIQSSMTLQSFSKITDYNDFIGVLLDDGVDPYLSSISVVGDIEEGSKSSSLEQTVPNSYLKVNTIGLFKDDKLMAFSNDEEDLGINFISNNIKQTLLYITYDDNIVNFNIDSSTTNVKVDYENNYKVTIEIKSEASINEILSNANLEDEKVIREMEDKAEEKIKNLVKMAFDLAKKNETDIFGIGNMIYKNDNKNWKSIKDNWNSMFKDIEYETKVNFKIISTSSLDNSLREIK